MTLPLRGHFSWADVNYLRIGGMIVKARERWQLVLLALYAEAVSCGSFAEVTAGTMDIPRNEFG